MPPASPTRSSTGDEDAVVGCWFGDGATSEGDWHEGLNFAGIHRLPVIFVCENNQYAISVPQSKQMAIEDVADRAAGYGFPGVVVDGNDVLACYGAMKQAHDRARAGEGPTLIECKTYRFLGHTSDDDDKTYRSRDEVEEARQPRSRARVRGVPASRSGVLDDVGAEELRAGVKDEIDAALAAAWEAADPEPELGAAPRLRRGARGRRDGDPVVTEKNVVTAIRDALHDEMADDDRIVLLGEDVGNRGGVFRISVGVDGGVRRASA